ncbi:hypothetical protein CI688_21690 [Shigella sonnei]|nr:hypothetical protein CI688_21690 [Shigella sonnei]
MMSLWDALRMNMMISYQELIRTFPNILNIAPASMPDTFFHFLSVHKNHSYNEFRCETQSPDQNRNGSMQVDVEMICDIVRDLAF